MPSSQHIFYILDHPHLPSFSLETASLHLLDVLLAATVLLPTATSEGLTLRCFAVLLVFQVARVVVPLQS